MAYHTAVSPRPCRRDRRRVDAPPARRSDDADGSADVREGPACVYVVGLIEHPDAIEGRFDERRIGLDHLAFHVPEQADLVDWVDHLDRLAVEHSGITQTHYEDAVTLRDPDGIQLELCWVNLAWWSAHLASGGDPAPVAGA